MMSDILTRAFQFFRMGQHAYAGLSWEAYKKSSYRRDDAGLLEAQSCIDRGDYLYLADIIEYKILPLYRGVNDVRILNVPDHHP